MPKQFSYRGHGVEELRQMSMDEFIKLLPSRQRRSLLKGLTNDERILLEHIRQSRKQNGGKEPVKRHSRDMIIIPEKLCRWIHIQTGKEYSSVEINPEFIGNILYGIMMTMKIFF